MTEQVTVTMSLRDWERQKAEIARENYENGTNHGHQTVWRFLKAALVDPDKPVHFGKMFPQDLREVVSEVLDLARQKRR